MAATRAHFFAGVVERYGACGGGMVGLLRMLAGEGDREMSDPDWSSFATSHPTNINIWKNPTEECDGVRLDLTFF